MNASWVPVVGVIGLGRMGFPVAKRLLEAGFSLIVLGHVRREPVQQLCDAGAAEAETPRRLAEAANVVITLLPSDAALRETILGRDGVVDGLRQGGILVDMGTTSPELTREVAAVMAASGREALDAPVSRGPQAATAGTLAAFVGGPAATLEKLQPVLRVLASDVTHMGMSGSGQTMKITSQLLSMVAMFNIVEVARLAVALGLDMETWVDSIAHSSGDSWMFQFQKPLVLAGGFETIANQPLGVKDLQLGIQLAASVGAKLRIASEAARAFAQLSDYPMERS